MTRRQDYAASMARRLKCETGKHGRHRITKDDRGRPMFLDATHRRGLCCGCGREIERAHTASSTWRAKPERGEP